MKEWYLQKGKPYHYSGLERGDFEPYRESFAELLEVSPFTIQAELRDTRITEAPRYAACILQNRTNDSIDSTGRRQILTQVGTMNRTSYVYADGEWYVAASDTDDQGYYEKTVLWKCNVELRFVSPLTGEPVIYPVYMTNATKYSSGEAYGRIRIETSQFSVLIPTNEETVMLRNGARFIVGLDLRCPTVYKISQVDSITYRYKNHALLMFMAVADEYNPERDDAMFGVADRFTTEDRLTEAGIRVPTKEETDEGWWG